MKLFKKLLPIASAASIAAIAIPLASCGNNQQSITVDMGNYLVNGYTRVTQPLGADTQIAVSEGTKTYFEAINKDPLIFADDMFDAIELLPAFLPTFLEIVQKEPAQPTIPTITDMSGTITFGNANINLETGRLAFDADLDLYIPDAKQLSEEYAYLDDLRIDLSIKTTNMLSTVTYFPERFMFKQQLINIWMLQANYVNPFSLSNDHQWNIALEGSITATAFGSPLIIDLSGDVNSKSDMVSLQYIGGILLTLPIPLMYMKNVLPTNAR